MRATPDPMKKALRTSLDVTASLRFGAPTRRLQAGVIPLVTLFAIASIKAEPAALDKKSRPTLHKLTVEPSSTSLAGGTAQLILTALVRKPGMYVGNYELKVTPYFFKSEKGRLSLGVSDQALRQLGQSSPAEFAGNATTAGSGKTRPTRVTAIPSAKDRGMLNISVTTENGPMVFKTPYRFTE
jgi:hypothetical protein